jgi:hypothetical protein
MLPVGVQTLLQVDGQIILWPVAAGTCICTWALLLTTNISMSLISSCMQTVVTLTTCKTYMIPNPFCVIGKVLFKNIFTSFNITIKKPQNYKMENHEKYLTE